MTDILIDAEFRSLIPPLAPEEYAGLEESIVEEGVRDAIILWNGYIVDGHNRYDIITKHGIKDYRVINKTFSDKEAAKIWIMRNQIGRRNISVYLRGEYLIEIDAFEKSRQAAREKQATGKYTCPTCGELFDIKVWHCPKCDHHWGMHIKECSNCHEYLFQNSEKGQNTTKELAQTLKVSTDTASRIIQIHEKAPEELKDKLRKGKATINFVYNKIRHEEKVQENLKRIETEKPLENITGKFQTIVIDPPWQYEANVMGRTRPPYATTDTIEDIAKYADDNCHLYLWTTNAFIPKACELIKQWGFEYKTIITWVKPSFGMGAYFRNSTEHILFAVKGHLSTLAKDIPTHFNASRNEHSEKPEDSYLIIERASFPPYLEIYATRKRGGNWKCMGLTT